MFRLNIILFSFLFAVIFSSCTNDIREVAAITANQKTPTQIGDSITLLYTDSARLKVVLKANRMLTYDRNVSEPFTVMPNGFFVTLFDENEKVSATLKGRVGRRYEYSKRMEALYEVVVVNTKGEKLETERLVWDENKKRIYTDAFVKITTDKEVITGKGLESNQDFSVYEIKEVTGNFQINDGL